MAKVEFAKNADSSSESDPDPASIASRAPAKPRSGGSSRAADPVETPVPRRRRWWPKLVLLLLVVMVLLPSGLSIFGQVPVVLKKLHPELAGILQFRTIQLHWWAPIEVKGLVVYDATALPVESDSHTPLTTQPAQQAQRSHDADGSDAAGNASGVLLSVESVSTIEPLWKIVLQRGRGISWDLVRPHLHLELNEHGSNLQATLNEITGPNRSAASDSFPVRVTIHNGHVTMLSAAVDNSSEDAARAAMVTDIQGTFSSLNLDSALPELQLQALIQTDLRAAEISAERHQLPDAADHVTRATNRPQRLAARLDELTSDFSMAPLPSLESSTSPSEVTGTALVGEPPESASRLLVSIASDTEQQGRQSVRIAARELDLRLLLPVLNYCLPDLVCDGMASCDIQAELAGRRLSDGLVGRFLVEGQQVRVRQSSWASGEWLKLGPTVASGAVAIAVDGLLLNDVRLNSDVLTLTGQGEIRHAATSSAAPAGAASVDSARSEAGTPENSAELRGTVDVAQVSRMLHTTLSMREDVQIQSGKLVFGIRGELVPHIRPADAPEMNITASTMPVARWQASIQNDRIEAVQAGRPLTLDAALRVDAVGPLHNGQPSIAQLRMTGGFGSIEVMPQDQAYQIVGNIQPQQLWEQLQQFVDLPRPGLRGDLTLRSRLAFHDDHFTLTGLQLNSADLKVSSQQLSCYPQHTLASMVDGIIHVEGTGAALRTLIAPWHAATWLAPHSSVVMHLTANPRQSLHLQARIQPSSMAAAVGIPIRSVAQSLHVAAPSLQVVSTGQRGSLPTEESAVSIDEATVDLLLQPSAQGTALEIQNGRIVLPGLAAQVRGTVGTSAGRQSATVASGGESLTVVDLTADTEYDLNVLCSRLLPADSRFRLNGRGRSTWRITGAPSLLMSDGRTPSAVVSSATASRSVPHVSPLHAEGSVAWDSGELWGLHLSGTTVQATLDQGIIRTQPIQCTLSGGQLNIMPQLHLLTQRLQLATGSRVENLQITPELCREWLGYVAPLLANSASVSGQVSARVERFDYSFQQPATSDIAATISVHRAEATPGDGLLSMLETVDLVRRAGKADRNSVVRSIVLPQQQVPVELRQGFIVHKGLIIELSGYRAQTSGGVGLNRELQLVLDIPLEKAGDRGDFRSVRIPVRGTIDAPQPDTAGLLQSLGTQAIERELNNTLDKQLNKLLDRF